MRALALYLVSILSLGVCATAAPKPHIITYGKWTTVRWYTGSEQTDPLDLKIRPLLVDGRIKEFILGSPHDITDRLFVVRRVFRLNDDLPQETGPARWTWQRGGWLLVDRTSGHITAVSLPDFDPYYSVGSWYRDYFAYCGVSDDGKKLFALVAELGRRKPILKQPLAESPDDDSPDSFCPAPLWQRQPARVTFEKAASENLKDRAVSGSGEGDKLQKLTFRIRGHATDMVIEDDDEESK